METTHKVSERVVDMAVNAVDVNGKVRFSCAVTR